MKSATDHPLARFLAGFLDDQRGAILVMFALLLPILLLFVGMTSDTSRLYLAQQSMLAALTSAVRSECAIDDSNPNENAARFEAFFDANYDDPDESTAPTFVNTLTGRQVSDTFPRLGGDPITISVEVGYPLNCR